MPGALLSIPDPDEKETVPLSAIEAITSHRCSVILGDPGSGKSTFLNHLGLCLAAYGLEPDGGWLQRLSNWPGSDKDVLPIAVVLRDFARTAPKKGNAEPEHLLDFIAERLKAKNLSEALDPLEKALNKGTALVLLDGLDEIPTLDQRKFVLDAISEFAGRYPDCRFVVTCRTLSYQDKKWQLKDFTPFTLAPLDESRIERFVDAWYSEQARLGGVPTENSGWMADRLKSAVRRDDLWELAPNPLLLTVMSLVHTHRGRLPEARALLYEETIDILLWRWDQLKAEGRDRQAPPLRQLLAETDRSDIDLKMALARLAFEVHRGQSDSESEKKTADITEQQLQDVFAELHPRHSLDWAKRVTETMKHRAGLLIEWERGVYSFPHRTFQEYLAGAYLASEGDFSTRAVELFEEGNYWRVAILLAAGKLWYLGGDLDRPLALVGELCLKPVAQNNADGWRKVWLAGEVLHEIGIHRAEGRPLGKKVAAEVRKKLVRILKSGRLSPVERAKAGNTLSSIGDPRFNRECGYLPDDPSLGFVEIPEGPFTMGSEDDRLRFDLSEVPQHPVNLPTFCMARFPVTVAQFRAFVEDSGFEPGNPDCLKGEDNHPVVRVSWHEALEYCAWVQSHLPDWLSVHVPSLHHSITPSLQSHTLTVTLPSEAEWEKAARGSDDARIYPWGNEPDPDNANYDDTGIGSTSSVGCFPRGRSPFQCEDMSGNVLEWTRSSGQEYPFDPQKDLKDFEEKSERRVLRGGSFARHSRYVRCALRDRSGPVRRDFYIGFRLCLSPISSL